MKAIRIYFVDFWNGFNPFDNFFVKFLSERYNIIVDSKKPDYLFYSSFGYNHFRFKKSIKIYFSSENTIPDFNLCDYALGFQYFELNDRYMRFPYYLFRDWDKINDLEKVYDLNESLFNRKFCNFVYSNGSVADPFRKFFFDELSKYKKVDSGGMYLNNIGYVVDDKFDFIRNYKFTIAFENSSTPGYTTEKLIQPMLVNSLPIYWGDPDIEYDFNIDSFVCVRGYESIKDAIDEIIFLDSNQDAYLKKLSERKVKKDNLKNVYREKLNDFFDNIFNQSLDQANRRVKYGYAMKYEWEQRRVAPLIYSYAYMKLCGLIERIKKVKI
ncbi:glycosyltransferase family 10 [uncultured Parabacteroides sp.]|uniref:glycosyltransferase family 10 domain-containing protein n=1 Tax=uncultured Parabacteroides sp. TaxID=512312 RepID=UPI00260A90E3|nr:glycosyltransferase family 10 [uncultured Parabacteroides sp.]